MAIGVALLLVFAPPIALKIIIIILSAIGFKEYANFAQKGSDASAKWIGTILCAVLTAAIIFGRDPLLYFTIILIASFLIHFRGNADLTVRVQNLTFFVFGIFYLGLLFAYWGLICGLVTWKFWVFLMLTCTFLSDTGAYIFGHKFGKNKLAPQISPGKTLEGFLGGWLTAALGSFVIRFLFRPDYPISHLLAAASLIALIGPLGDLSESLLKRGLNVKDSGNLIPGHGGFLDRVDALLFAGPVVYYFAVYFDRL